jgi:hypothetical protein
MRAGLRPPIPPRLADRYPLGDEVSLRAESAPRKGWIRLFCDDRYEVGAAGEVVGVF